MIKHNIRKCLSKSHGFTLIELLVVMVLLGMILGVAYAAFHGTFMFWSHNEAINPYIAATNNTLSIISREIRSAEQPSATEPAVKTLNDGKQMIIYKYNLTSNTWDMICYRYKGTALQRTVQGADTGAAVVALGFPDDTAVWHDQLNGIAADSQDNSFVTETDKVNITLLISDVEQPDNKRFADYNVASTYFPRNRAPGSIYSEAIEEEEEEVPNVPIYKLELLNSFSPLMINNGQTTQLRVRFWPANTTADKTVTTANEYVSIQQDANDPTLIILKGIKRTPTLLGINLPQNVTLKSGDKSTSFYVVVK
ncbi:MAG: PulJ/GspJ family protein [Syntrophomonadaceae bacterium]|jgi:prepilin-type N-terminal cleavage/methylation domain-containing protein